MFEPREVPAAESHPSQTSLGNIGRLAAPAPLPSRVSVLPFVASVSPESAYETGRHPRSSARRRSAVVLAAIGLAAALVSVGALLAMRLERQSSVETSAAASQPLPPGPPSAPVQAHAARDLPASEPAVPEADVNDLPRAPPIRRAVAAGGARPMRPSVATSAAKGGPAASAEAAALSPSEAASAAPPTSSASASPAAPSDNASAVPEMPPAAPLALDPFVKAVQQSIDEAHQKP